MMTQGTVSILLGCHSVIHSYFVWKSWRILYNEYPGFKETVCILLHDIGHLGKNYLNDEREKNKHWILGARVARKLFGFYGFWLIAGHDRSSHYVESPLYKPDKYSWYIAPKWWLYTNNIFEPGLKKGMSSRDAVNEFKEKVRQNIESGEYRPTHSFYIEREDKNAAKRRV